MHKRHYELFRKFSQLIEDRKKMRKKAKKQCYYRKEHT